MELAPRFVLDTNTVLYLLGGCLAETLPDGDYYISVITEIELLCYPYLGVDEETKIKAFLHDIEIIPLTQQVKAQTIILRKLQNLKLPDAIIAATALIINGILMTNDQKLLSLPNVPAKSITLTLHK